MLGCFIGSSRRTILKDGSFVDWSIVRIEMDQWRPHGIKYRIAWIQKGRCRVLFDNHHGKRDHSHVDGFEMTYEFLTVDQLWTDFSAQIELLGGSI